MEGWASAVIIGVVNSSQFAFIFPFQHREAQISGNPPPAAISGKMGQLVILVGELFVELKGLDILQR